MGEVGQPVFCIFCNLSSLWGQPVDAGHSLQRLRDEQNPVGLLLLELHLEVEMPPKRGKSAKSVKSSADPRHSVQVAVAQVLEYLEENLRWQIHQIEAQRHFPQTSLSLSQSLGGKVTKSFAPP